MLEYIHFKTQPVQLAKNNMRIQGLFRLEIQPSTLEVLDQRCNLLDWSSRCREHEAANAGDILRTDRRYITETRGFREPHPLSLGIDAPFPSSLRLYTLTSPEGGPNRITYVL